MNYFGRGNLELAPWFLRCYEAAGQLASQSDQPTAMIVTNQKESFTTCVHVNSPAFRPILTILMYRRPEANDKKINTCHIAVSPFTPT